MRVASASMSMVGCIWADRALSTRLGKFVTSTEEYCQVRLKEENYLACRNPRSPDLRVHSRRGDDDRRSCCSVSPTWAKRAKLFTALRGGCRIRGGGWRGAAGNHARTLHVRADHRLW